MRCVVRLCVEPSLPVPGDPPGKGHLVGSWVMNQKNLAATVISVLSCAAGFGMIPAPAGASAARSLLGNASGQCLRGTGAHWACRLEGVTL